MDEVRVPIHMDVTPPKPQVKDEFTPSNERDLPFSAYARSGMTQRLAKRPISPPRNLKIRDVDILVIEDRCKGCSFCIEFCPKDVLEQSTRLNARGAYPPRVKDPDRCVGCGVCEEVCPDFAIFLVKKRKGN